MRQRRQSCIAASDYGITLHDARRRRRNVAVREARKKGKPMTTKKKVIIGSIVTGLLALIGIGTKVYLARRGSAE